MHTYNVLVRDKSVQHHALFCHRSVPDLVAWSLSAGHTHTAWLCFWVPHATSFCQCLHAAFALIARTHVFQWPIVHSRNCTWHSDLIDVHVIRVHCEKSNWKTNRECVFAIHLHCTCTIMVEWLFIHACAFTCTRAVSHNEVLCMKPSRT